MTTELFFMGRTEYAKAGQYDTAVAATECPNCHAVVPIRSFSKHCATHPTGDFADISEAVTTLAGYVDAAMRNPKVHVVEFERFVGDNKYTVRVKRAR